MKKYKPIKKQKNKMSIEKGIVIKAAVSVTILIWCVIVSSTNYFEGQKQFINSTINRTSDMTDIRNIIDGGKKLFSYATKTAGTYFDKIVCFFDSGLKNENPSISVSATSEQATPYIYPPKPEEKEKEQPEEQQKTVIFNYPVKGKITSPFGGRTHPVKGSVSTHYGVDIAGNEGDVIISCLAGKVSDTGFDASLGNYVKVKHSESMETVYGHMSKILVKKDEIVDDNTAIGNVGSTGSATGPHVHLEVRINGVCENPENYLSKPIQPDTLK